MPLSFKYGLPKNVAEVTQVGNPEEDAIGQGKKKDKGFSLELVTSERTEGSRLWEMLA